MAEQPEQQQELKLKIMGVEYPFPSFDTLSYKEARRIKKETGLVMGQFFQALENGDPDALLASALIAKLRDDPGFDPDELSELMLTDIEIVAPAAANGDGPEPASPLAESSPSSGDRTSVESGSSVEKSADS